jgi:hypothetical protein
MHGLLFNCLLKLHEVYNKSKTSGAETAYPFRNCLPFQILPTLSETAYPFRYCLPFQKLPTLSDISAVRIAQSLDFYTMFCGSIFDLLSFISLLAIVLII